MWLLAAAAIVAALLILVPLFGSQSARTTGPSGLAGQTAPVFALQNDRGEPVSLAKYRGQVVVMNLWASWCPPCRAEMPDLQHLYQSYKTRNVIVLGVDQGESAPRVASFAQSLGIHYPILLDQQQQYGRVYAALGLPTTVVVSAQGTVVRGFDGPLSYPQMVAAVAPLLDK